MSLCETGHRQYQQAEDQEEEYTPFEKGMWALNIMKAKTGFIKETQPEPATQPLPRKKRSSEEDAKASMKRAALLDVTNKPAADNGRITRAQAKKKELESQQISLLCMESSVSIIRPQQKSTSPVRSTVDRMSIDGDSFKPLLHLHLHPDAAAAQEQERAQIELIPHEDIDFGDDGDPQLCKIYVNEIYEYLRENEVRYQPGDYMETQKELNPSMRAILVDWLVEVAEEYKLSSDTLYLGVCYLDRYLSRKSVPRSKLQLVGVACMLLASYHKPSKYEEIYAPSVDEFVYISDNTYCKEEVFIMEANVLDVLEFSLSIATTKNFLRRFLKAAYAETIVHMFANYLCELALHEYTFVKFLPSVVAASAVYLALRTAFPSKSEIWNSTLEYYTRHRPSDLDMRTCIQEMHAMHKTAPKNHTQAVFDKYNSTKYMRVANHKIISPSATVL